MVIVQQFGDNDSGVPQCYLDQRISAECQKEKYNCIHAEGGKDYFEEEHG